MKYACASIAFSTFAIVVSDPVLVLCGFESVVREVTHAACFDLFTCLGFLSIRLESYLEDVPPEKILVISNYRGLISNIFFIRNNEAGRRLAYDWLAVAKSGYIQCHGFDQVPERLLFLFYFP